jgi:sugar O-acyltransferase (sialic acid O-acetyltransferase NeuD family)
MKHDRTSDDLQELVIVGAGGFGRELLEMLPDVFPTDQFRLKGFLARDVCDLESHGLDAKVLGDPEDYRPEATDRFLLAIGDIDARRTTVESIQSRGGQFVRFVHPLARIARTATLGQGAVIYPFAVVSNQSQLADFVHLNYYASVGHDCRVGRYCLLAPYGTLNGCVTLEDEVYISTHGTVAPGRTMHYRSKLSANSACMRDAAANSLIFGVPGKQVPRLS